MTEPGLEKTECGSAKDMSARTPTLYCWNPKRRRFSRRWLRRLPLYRQVNNFGDLLGPMIAARLLERHGYRGTPRIKGEPGAAGQNLLTVGSVLHFAKTGDIVWGSGRNGKIANDKHCFDHLDIRMVRGPLTKAFLEARGCDVPAVFGDPGLLIADVFPELRALAARKRHELTVIPNLNDGTSRFSGYPVVSPTGNTWRILRRIAQSDCVVTSSLHGIIVAEALGVPVRVLHSRVEPDFKYRDYFLGTGRETFPAYATVKEALAGDSPAPLDFCPAGMIDTFPFEMFEGGSSRQWV